MLNEQEIEKLKAELAKGLVVVFFKKADGTMREMQATLAPYLLPETAGTGRKTSKDVQVVFDLEIEQWRSFRYDSVVEVFYNVEE